MIKMTNTIESFNKTWRRYFPTKDRAKCPLCRKSIMYKDVHSCGYQKGAWHRGHIVAKTNSDDNTPDNIRPICWSCNRDSGTMDMRDYAVMKGYNYDRSIIPPKDRCGCIIL